MATLEELISDKEILKEYNRSFLLNIFKKLCVRMDKDPIFKTKVLNLYRQSFNKCVTTKILIKDIFDYDLTIEESEMFTKWMKANLSKSKTRRQISSELKEELIKKQNGICLSCGEPLSTDKSKIHVDHIVPFKLVGDELEDNYQVLCDICNECKSSRIDYIFISKIKLN